MRSVPALSFAGVASVGAVLALAGCPTPIPPAIADARPPDAPGDAGRCPGELFFTGAYVDWDSTETDFHGIGFATFRIDDTTDAAHMDQTSPNGRAELCIPSTGRASIGIVPATGDMHLSAHFIADATVFGGGLPFSARGITAARAATFFTAESLTYASDKADLFVQEFGSPPAALSLTGATYDQAMSSPDGVTWTLGSTADEYVMFANVVVTGTPMLAGPSEGAGEVAMKAGEMTYTSVIP